MSNKLLCDIGNTNFSFSNGKIESVEHFDISSITEKVYYISVNKYWEKRLSMQENWINLRSFIDFSKYYKTMGIDRIMAVIAIDNGLIIDAGSAITVDLVKEGIHKGGYIYPGLRALSKCFKDISPALEVSFNFELDLAKMPLNTQDALTYGAIAPLLSNIREIAQDLPIYITGGDARVFIPKIEHSVLDNELVFKGMRRLIEGKIC